MRVPQQIVRVLAYRTVARLGAALLQALALVLVARDLGVAGFGEFVLGVTGGSILGGLLGLGVSARALRIHRELDPSRLAQLMINYSAGAAVLTGLVVTIAMWAWGGQLPLASATGAIVVSDQFCSSIQAVLAGLRRYRASANVILAQRAVAVLGIGVALLRNADAIHGYAIAAISIAAGVAVWQVRPAAGLGAAELARGAWGYILASSSGMMANLDVSVVRLCAGAQAAGLYGAASRLVSPLSIAVSTLLSVVVPHGAAKELRSDRASLYSRALKAVALASAGLAGLSPLIAEGVVRVLGPDYRSARFLLVAVVVGVALSAVSQVLQAELLTEGYAGSAGILVGVGTAVGLAVMAVAGALGGLVWLWAGPLSMQIVILTLLFGARKRLVVTGEATLRGGFRRLGCPTRSSRSNR